MSGLPRMETKPAKVSVVRREIEKRTIVVPLMAETFDGYFSDRIDMKLTTTQAKTLKSVLFGLQSKFTTLANGKEIANGSDALKWILEEMGNQGLPRE
jgi:hypothetical protein